MVNFAGFEHCEVNHTKRYCQMALKMSSFLIKKLDI